MPELKARLRQLGLSATGRKADLMARLNSALSIPRQGTDASREEGGTSGVRRPYSPFEGGVSAASEAAGLSSSTDLEGGAIGPGYAQSNGVTAHISSPNLALSPRARGPTIAPPSADPSWATSKSVDISTSATDGWRTAGSRVQGGGGTRGRARNGAGGQEDDELVQAVCVHLRESGGASSSRMVRIRRRVADATPIAAHIVRIAFAVRTFPPACFTCRSSPPPFTNGIMPRITR